jgi:hypothetical protein
VGWGTKPILESRSALSCARSRVAAARVWQGATSLPISKWTCHLGGAFEVLLVTGCLTFMLGSNLDCYMVISM